MKKRLFPPFILIVLLLTINVGYSQVSINSTGESPDGSAMLDVQSDSSGVLVPRMTAVQRGQINNPATGLLVYQTDGTTGFYYNGGAPASPSWIQLSSTLISELSDTDGDTRIEVEASPDADSIHLTTGGTIRMAINPDGKIGIGTRNPDEKISFAGGNLNHYAYGNPTLTGTYNTSGSSRDVYVSGKYAYIADAAEGLQIIDISNPSVPSLTGTCNPSGLAFGVYVSGSYAYVADYDSGLHIIDISNPSAPSLTGTYNPSGQGRGVYVSGKYAYVACGGGGLHIIDISNPSAPSLLGTYNTSGHAMGVYVSGKYAYVADAAAGLQIIDISNPSVPSLTGTYNTSGSAFGVYASGKYAYVADEDAGLHIIDISNASSPSLTGTYNTSGSAQDVYLAGNYAYVTDYDAGLHIIDISNPSSPSRTGTYNPSGLAFGVYISGKYAYMAYGGIGLQIIDINGLKTPSIQAGNIQSNDITVTENLDVGNNLYIRNGLNIGLGGMKSDGPGSFHEVNAVRSASVGKYAGYFEHVGTACYGLRVRAGDASIGQFIWFYRGPSNTYSGNISSIAGILSLVQPSDKRLKKEIVNTKLHGIDILQNLRVVDYKLKNGDETVATGYIAQEAMEAYPEMAVYDESEDLYQVSTMHLIPVLHKAIQEQQEIIDKLKARVEELER